MSMPSRIKNAAEPRVVAIRDALWTALRAGSVQTYADLRTQCGGSADDVRCWTSLWRRAGILRATPQGLEMLPEYRAQETPPPASAFRGRTIMARSWDAIRVLKRFTVQDLELAAQITPRAARAHISTLRRAGYLRATTRDHYLFVRPTGPRPPRLVRTPDGPALQDQNDRQLHPIQRRGA